MPAQSLPNVLAEMKSQDVEPNLIFFNHHLAWIKSQLPTVTYCDFFVVCLVCQQHGWCELSETNGHCKCHL